MSGVTTTVSGYAPLVERVLATVHEQGVQLVSLDIFDTLVYRRVTRPTEIFKYAFERVQSSLSLPMTAAEYCELRVSTEVRVKRETAYGEVSFETIIAGLPFLPDVRAELLKAELATEAEYGFVSEEMVQLVEALSDMNVPVVLISDMYLSKAQIQQTFFTRYPQLLALPLFVSSEYQKNKASGTLFHLVQAQYQIDYANWLHVGDNRVADQDMPAKLGMHAVLLSSQLEQTAILRQEAGLFSTPQPFNAARLIASTLYAPSGAGTAFSLATFVWGPILLAFADWIIDQARASNSRSILCLMREAEVFAPIVEWRLAHRQIKGIAVHKLYASRKSTFWPAIDVAAEQWFEDLVYVLVQRRGYSVSDFYRDFRLPQDDIYHQYEAVAIRDTDGVFHQGMNLLKLLTDKARDNKAAVEAYINEQRARFVRYYEHHIGTPLSESCVVDLGNGGTIPHHIECILGCQSAANLLFYSSERIYRYAQKTHFSTFIGAQSDSRNVRQLLSRSPECIEPFLVGDCGTVTGYSDDANATPVQADRIEENSANVKAFLVGLHAYFSVHHRYDLPTATADQVLPILFRYLQLPCKPEAQLFTQLLHQDNFGSNLAYPIITDAQCKEVAEWPIADFYLTFSQYPKIKVGRIHWPQAVITLCDDKFLARQFGLMSMDTDTDVLNLVERILDQQWQSFSVYGAGLFFEKLLPYLNRYNLNIEHLIDRKADISGPYEVAGFTVKPLKQALDEGCGNILISSFAFKEEIARNIHEQSVERGLGNLNILSL